MFIMWEERLSCGILLGEPSHTSQAKFTSKEECQQDFPKQKTTNSETRGENEHAKQPIQHQEYLPSLHVK